MSNWYTDKICPKCKGKIATNGDNEWCENCVIIKPVLTN